MQPKVSFYHCVKHVECLNTLEVTIDLMEAVVETLTDMSLNVNRKWNRDKVAQASAY